MEDRTRKFQVELMNDITLTESILLMAKDLVAYLNLGPKFFQDLELTSSTIQELLRRIPKTPEKHRLDQLVLAAKQVKLMANDLLDVCKEKMYSA